MKKFIVAALAAAVATISFTDVAEARNRGFNWNNNGHHNGWHNRGWHNRGWRNNRGWRHHGWRNHRGWRHHAWRGRGWGPGYWGPGFGIVIGPAYADSYCFVKKVRRHDANGNRYVKRVRVCR